MAVDIFYQELSYEEIQQNVAFEFLSLLSEIGGFLGLLLGASVLTVCELIDFVTLATIYRFKRDKKMEQELPIWNEHDNFCAILTLVVLCIPILSPLKTIFQWIKVWQKIPLYFNCFLLVKNFVSTTSMHHGRKKPKSRLQYAYGYPVSQFSPKWKVWFKLFLVSTHFLLIRNFLTRLW